MKIVNKQLLLGLTLLASVNLSHGQFNKLKDKVKNAGGGGGGQTQEAAAPKLPALVYDRPIPTAVMYSSLMNHMEFSETGRLTLDHISIAFPPNKDETGAAPDYREKRFHVRVTKGDAVVSDKYYTPQYSYETYIKFENESVEGSDVDMKEGKYTIHFMIDDKIVSEVPVEVVKLENKDPYANVKAKYFLRGPKNDYCYLKWTDKEDLSGNESPKLHLNTFYVYEDIENKGKDDVPVHSELFKDGKYLATTTKDELDFTNEWNTFENVFFKIPVNAPTDTDKILRKKDLVDGKYQIKNFVEGKVRIFSFDVKGGVIVPSGRQVRETTEPTKFIEGMNETWWVQVQNGTYMKP